MLSGNEHISNVTKNANNTRAFYKTILGNRQCDAAATTTATMNDSVFNIRAVDMEYDNDVYNLRDARTGIQFVPG